MDDLMMDEGQGKALDQLKWMYEESDQLTREQAQNMDTAERYYHSKQLTQQQMKEFRKRGQSAHVNNRIKRSVDWMLGHEIETRSNPKAHPRNPGDEKRASIRTQLLRYVADDNRYHKVSSRAAEDLWIRGVCGVEVALEYTKRGAPKIRTHRHQGQTLFYDPRSQEADFSDATYLGVAKWVDQDDYADDYPELADEIRAQTSTSSTGSGIMDVSRADRPDGRQWGDARRRRILVVQMWYKHRRVWRVAEFSGDFVAYDMVSPYLDNEGEPRCNLIMQSCYVDDENQRYGIVHDMISLQDELNSSRSIAQYRMTQRQTYGKKGAVASVNGMKMQLAHPHGHLEISPGSEWGRDIGIIDQSDQIQGHLAMMQDAKAELDVQGPNSGLRGRGVEQQSGRAIQAQQSAGLREEAMPFDRHRDLNLRVYQCMSDMIDQFYTDEIAVPITDDPKAGEFLIANQVVSVDPMTGQEYLDADSVMQDLDVDIRLDETPAGVNIQQEDLRELLQIAGNRPEVPFDLLVEMSSITDKERIVSRLAQSRQEAAQAAAPMQQVAQAKNAADIQKTRAEAQKIAAQTEGERVETAKAVRDMMLPPEFRG